MNDKICQKCGHKEKDHDYYYDDIIDEDRIMCNKCPCVITKNFIDTVYEVYKKNIH